MHKRLALLALTLVISTAWAIDAEEKNDEENALLYEAFSPRVFFSNLSSTTATSAALAAVAVLVITAIILLIILLALYGDDKKGGGEYYGGQEGGYDSQYAARRNDDIDWSALNILDYISMMEEVWRKFDVKDMECQKRVICELHQNEEEFGSMATNVVSMFKYLRYLTLVKLPGDMQNTFADYLHAAEQGRSDKNDCAKVFDTCDFSIKDTYNKYFSKDNKLKKK